MRTKKAFTLLELMIVLAIISILTPAVIPKVRAVKQEEINKKVDANVFMVKSFLLDRKYIDKGYIIDNKTLEFVRGEVGQAMEETFTASRTVENPFTGSKVISYDVDALSSTAPDSAVIVTVNAGLLPQNEFGISISGKQFSGKVIVVIYRDGYVGCGIDRDGQMVKPFVIKFPSEVAFKLSDIVSSTPPTNQLPNLGNYALFATSINADPVRPAIKLDGSASIHGNVGTNSSIADSIRFSSSSYIYGNLSLGTGGDPRIVIDTPRGYSNGDADVPPEVYNPSEPAWKWHDYGAYWKNVTGHISSLPSVVNYPLPTFPNYPTLTTRPNVTTSGNKTATINQDGYYDTIQAESNTTINIDMGGGDRTIRVRNFNIVQGTINIINNTGNGKLSIYIEDKFTLNGSSSFNYNSNTPGDAAKVYLYYSGSNSISLGGSTKFSGNMFVNRASVNYEGSNNFRGNIVTLGPEINVSGSAQTNGVIVYAPNSHLEVGGSGTINGSVVAKTYELSGSSVVRFSSSVIQLPSEFFGSGTN